MPFIQTNGKVMPNWTARFGNDPKSARTELAQLEARIKAEGGAKNAPSFEQQRNSLSWYITAIENPSYYQVNPDGSVKSLDPGRAPEPTYPGTTYKDSSTKTGDGGTGGTGGNGTSGNGTSGNGTGTGSTGNPTMEDIKKMVDSVAGTAAEYGDTLANKYIPQGTFGTIDEGTSPEMKAYIDRLNQFAQSSGNLSPYEQQSLDQLQSGLGGYLAPELQAMREQRLQELDSELATQRRQQALAASRSGIRGAYLGAQQANLGRQAVQTRGNIEQDLFIKNADAVQQRRQAFADLVRRTEDARFGRRTQAEDLYGRNLAGEEATQTGIKQFNVGQRQNEALARGGLALGGAGTYTGLYGNEQANEMAQGYYDLAKTQNQQYFDYLNKQLAAMRQAMKNNYGAGAA